MTIKQILETIEEGQALKTIAGVYTEIASSRLKRIRAQVIYSRTFFEEIISIYALIKQTASKKTESKKLKSLSILITSNNKFYGHIDTDLVKFFLSRNKLNGDIICIGRGGKNNLEAYGITKFNLQVFEKDLPSPEELIALTTLVKKYEQVLIYFPRFQTVLKQTPIVLDITQSQASALNLSNHSEEAFLFEPEVSKIIDFFDLQLKNILIEQTFLEAELARVGSRLIFMDQAQFNADKFLDVQQNLLTAAKRSVENSEILEAIFAVKKVNQL